MTRRLKLLTGMSALAATSAVALAGYAAEGEGESSDNVDQRQVLALLAGAEGESEGGESEGEGSSEVDPANDDVEFSYRLGLVRGHLIAFRDLYDTGEFAMAGMHVKHPKSEIYAGIKRAFKKRKLPGFAKELKALVAASGDQGEIAVAYQSAMNAIDAHIPEMTIGDQLMVASKMVRTAADEFGIGVDEQGAIVNAHEYQDAYGFLTAARASLSIDDTNADEAEAVSVVHAQIDAALTIFEDLTVSTTMGKASTLYGAAARIEIAALGVM